MKPTVSVKLDMIDFKFLMESMSENVADDDEKTSDEKRTENKVYDAWARLRKKEPKQ